MKSIIVLLIEDNEGDILLTREAFEVTKIAHEMRVIKDGEAAIRFFKSLTGVDKIPYLVLLDINLPKVNGHEVLKYIKTHEKFKEIPVIILTTSSSAKDIEQSYKHHVNCYVIKPVDASDFMQAITTIENFWINIAANSSSMLLST